MINNSLRVFRNTISLYMRTIILTLISLFSVRIVLNVLGASDYGIYNVVGGVVTMFTFISSSLSISSQRYYAIHLASDDWNGVSKMFSINMVIYLVFSVIIFLLAETIGLWFVINKLNYDIARTEAVVVVYETSIVSFVLSVLISPFLALLVADENLSLYSVVSIIEGILKVAVVFFLYTIRGDKLIIYTILVTLATLFINSIYFLYIKYKYRKLKFKIIKNAVEYRTVFSYLNWNLIGSVASVCKGQGINIIINIFFGTTINAARGIASQINGVISSFSQNFMKAVDPQITKAYALEDDDRFFRLIHVASKMSFSLLFFFSMPILFNSNYILSLWLKNAPQYSVWFTNLVLIDAMIASITDPILTAVQATGKVRLYQISIGGINLLNLPLSYILLKSIRNPLIPFVVAIAVSIMMGIGRVIVFRKIYHFNIRRYFLDVIIPMLLITTISTVVMSKLMSCATSLITFMIKVIGSGILNVLLVFFIGLSKDERNTVVYFISEIKDKRMGRKNEAE